MRLHLYLRLCLCIRFCICCIFQRWWVFCCVSGARTCTRPVSTATANDATEQTEIETATATSCVGCCTHKKSRTGRRHNGTQIGKRHAKQQRQHPKRSAIATVRAASPDKNDKGDSDPSSSSDSGDGESDNSDEDKESNSDEENEENNEVAEGDEKGCENWENSSRKQHKKRVSNRQIEISTGINSLKKTRLKYIQESEAIRNEVRMLCVLVCMQCVLSCACCARVGVRVVRVVRAVLCVLRTCAALAILTRCAYNCAWIGLGCCEWCVHSVRSFNQSVLE